MSKQETPSLRKWEPSETTAPDGKPYYIKSGEYQIARYSGSQRYGLFKGSEIVKSSDDLDYLKGLANA